MKLRNGLAAVVWAAVLVGLANNPARAQNKDETADAPAPDAPAAIEPTDAESVDPSSLEAEPPAGADVDPPASPDPAEADTVDADEPRPRQDAPIGDDRPGAVERPAPKPKGPTADELIGEMLKPPPTTGERALPTPEEGPAPDKTSGRGAVKPDAPVVNVLREGTFIVDRVGRLSRSADGGQAEFAFEADGQALQDPPVVIIPNLKLMAMEDAVQSANRDLRFRVTGQVTEYRGRNYVLLEKVVVVPEVTQQFRRDY